MISVTAGNQLCLFRISSPRMNTLGQSSIGKGTPLLGMICLATRTEAVSRPMSGTIARFSGCVLSSGILIGLLSMQISVSFSISSGIDDGRRDRRVAEDVMLDAGRVDDGGVEIQQRLAVREIERRVGVHLTPDEHVLGRQRNLVVAVAHVGVHARHDLFLRDVDLRIQVRKAELAAAPAAGRHLDDPEGRALVGHEDLVARPGMADFDLPGQVLAADGAARTELIVSADSARPFDDAVDAQVVPGVGLGNLPAAGPADDDLELLAERDWPSPARTSRARSAS